MPFGAIADIGLGLVGSALGLGNSNSAAQTAGDATVQAAQLGIDEQRRQFDIIQGLLQPFQQGGSQAFSQQLALSGALGDEEFQNQIDSIRGGPEYQSLVEDSEEAILNNASALGGLRGGRTALAVAENRPRILSDLIGQRFDRLGSLSGLGQASAAQTAGFAQQTGSAIAGLQGTIGSANAGVAIARGNNTQQFIDQGIQAITSGIREVF